MNTRRSATWTSTKTQAEHLATPKTGEKLGLDHRPVPPRPKAAYQCVDTRAVTGSSATPAAPAPTVRDVTEPALRPTRRQTSPHRTRHHRHVTSGDGIERRTPTPSTTRRAIVRADNRDCRSQIRPTTTPTGTDTGMSSSATPSRPYAATAADAATITRMSPRSARPPARD